jgi:uncharacterized iron-regulated membrane protein
MIDILAPNVARQGRVKKLPSRLMPETRPPHRSSRRFRISTITTALIAALVIGMLLLAIYVWLQRRRTAIALEAPVPAPARGSVRG